MIVKFVQNTDHRVERFMDNNQTELGIQALDSLTSLGSVLFNLLILVFLWSFGKTVVAQELAVGLTAVWITLFILKHLVKRERPEHHIDHVISRTSFPSGHSGAAFLTATVLSAHLGRSLIFFGLAAIVAFSRLYLEDHYLSDVVVGTGIGLVIGQILITV